MKRYRSAVDGKLVNRDYAVRNPDTTVAEEIEEVTDEWIEHLCEVMHDAYEAAADKSGWQTQEASRKPWSEVPEANKKTMRVAVRALVKEIR